MIVAVSRDGMLQDPYPMKQRLRLTYTAIRNEISALVKRTQSYTTRPTFSRKTICGWCRCCCCIKDAAEFVKAVCGEEDEPTSKKWVDTSLGKFESIFFKLGLCGCTQQSWEFAQCFLRRFFDQALWPCRYESWCWHSISSKGWLTYFTECAIHETPDDHLLRASLSSNHESGLVDTRDKKISEYRRRQLWSRSSRTQVMVRWFARINIICTKQRC